jgi:hypothetical protein
VSNCQWFYTEHRLTGTMSGKVGLRPFTGTAAVTVATLLSGGLPIQGADAPVAPTSYISEVFSEVEQRT